MEVTVVGDIDAVNGRPLGGYVERRTGISKQLILDLRAVDFFGSQGFTALSYIRVHCTRSDVDWVLLAGPPVRRFLAIFDPDSELPLAADLDGAIARLDHLARHLHRTASAG